MVEYTFTTPCSHYGTIQPVRATTGRQAGNFSCKIKGPRVTGSSGVKTVYAQPKLAHATVAIASFLHIQASRVDVQVPPSAATTTLGDPASPVKSEPSSAMVTPPRAQKFGKDILRPSPNSRAKCGACGNKIIQGQLRIGKWTFNASYDKYYHKYYHESCASPELKASLRLPDPGIEQERQALLRSRDDLRQRLRGLRTAFARRLNVAHYIIFNDVTLDDLIVRLPVTKSELIQCHGIKEKKFQSFGSAIMTVCRHYKQEAGHHVEEEDGIEVGETLSCEDIVQQKFQHAEDNGYTIVI